MREKMFIYSFPLEISLSTKKVFLRTSLSLPWNPIVGDAFTFSGDNELIAGEVGSRCSLLTPSIGSFLSLLLFRSSENLPGVVTKTERIGKLKAIPFSS